MLLFEWKNWTPLHFFPPIFLVASPSFKNLYDTPPITEGNMQGGSVFCFILFHIFIWGNLNEWLFSIFVKKLNRLTTCIYQVEKVQWIMTSIQLQEEGMQHKPPFNMFNQGSYQMMRSLIFTFQSNLICQSKFCFPFNFIRYG